MVQNWWSALLLVVGLCWGPSFVLAASGDAGDIMFVLDGSGSISADDFVRAKSFISQVVDAFDIAADFTRVGVVQFSSFFTEEFPLDGYSDKASLKQAIGNIPQRGGGTLLGQVINYLVNTSFTEAKGARPLSQGIPRIAVLMTDGSAHDNPTTVLAPAIDALRASGIIAFSIGVGPSVNRDQLEAVAGDTDRVFQVGTYSVINSIRDLLVERVREIIELPSSPRPPTVEPSSTQSQTPQLLTTSRATTQHPMTSKATTQRLTTSKATTQRLTTSKATTQLPMTSTSSTTQIMTPIATAQLQNTTTATVETKKVTPTNTVYYIAGGVGGALLLLIILVIIVLVIKCREHQDEPEVQDDPFEREELGPREFVFTNPAFGNAENVPTNRWQEAAGHGDPAPEEPLYVNMPAEPTDANMQNSTFSKRNVMENVYV
ncbi:matrilin-2-like [Branchiostoma floridae]|uniref:Matrilin-2-like n=1 Tax=Branchiostoma floridae TaxID=7739 RepID=A0A9J7MYQ0_BRAFL|nr:matrilin-2-like [Branchiostoma floridae]